ncbi:MAG: peroxiredoxin, partial [Actinomycetota bacterium]|nr:peroxiredoxin [Actinomycetota bacterium]
PDFALRDQSGQVKRLSDYRGRKVVLYFYPADDTPGCTAEACDFRDSLVDLKQAGYEVLGVSPQDEASHRAFIDKYGLNFPLLVDEDTAAARAYGVAHEGGDWRGIPLRVQRATFVIDEDGKLTQALYGIKARGHVENLKQGLGIS